jgi:UTP--glucose-1-phosphate uridylyltransferase
MVHLPDDLIHADTSCLKQMVASYMEHGSSVIAVEDVPREKTSSYGIVDIDSGRRNSAY